MTKLEELKQRHAELKNQILEESKAWFKEASQGLFDAHPEIQSFAWSQYTPYFNDGDECVFRVNSEPKINGVDWYDEPEEGQTKFERPVYKEVEKLIDSIDQPTLKEMFGDHCEVTARRDGITVASYEHD